MDDKTPATFRDRIRKSMDDHPKTVLFTKLAAVATVSLLGIKTIRKWASDCELELDDNDF